LVCSLGTGEAGDLIGPWSIGLGREATGDFHLALLTIGGFLVVSVAIALTMRVRPVHPRRWVVERFFAWLGRNHRLAKDFEATIASATAFLYAASVLLLTRRLARSV
jgi:hypothetical protein